LVTILANAKIIENSGSKKDVVQIAARVTIQEGSNEPEVYTIVGHAEANPREGRISNESPIGRALLEHHVGDIVTVEAPSGSYKVHILKVE